MKTNTLLFFLGLYLFCSHGLAQLTGSELSPSKSVDSVKQTSVVPHVEGIQVHRADFNDGHITDPLQLVQGRLPALLISRAGNDPNGVMDLRLRGLKSFDVTEPLFVIDGIPVTNLAGIHPNDIESVKVLRGGAESAVWGIRGANGVVEIKTRRGRKDRPIIQYQAYVASENISKTPDLMNAQDYERFGGTDFGSSTDWWEEITRRAISQTHHISLSGGTNTSSYYASLNYEDVSGIALGSGFDRINGRLSLEQRALNDRLNIQLGLSSTHRESELMPLYAFWHATSYNPTAPVLGEGDEFERFGGYFEHEIFRNFNPVAMIELNEFQTRYQQLMAYGKASLQLNRFATASVRYGKQTESLAQSFFSPATSYFLGYFGNGQAERSTVQRNNAYASAELQAGAKIGKLSWSLNGSYHYQDITKNILFARGGDFLTDVFRYNNLSAANDFASGLGEVDSRKVRHELLRYGGQLHLNYDDRYFFSATANREGSSILGANRKWGWFYGIQATASLGERMAVRTSYGLTGNLPSEGMLSQQIYQPMGTMFFNGSFTRSYGTDRYSNPNLQWEQNAEWSIGTDFLLMDKRLIGSLDYYRTQSTQLINQQEREIANNLFYDGHQNVGAVSSSGLEYALTMNMAPNRPLDWQLSVVGARYFRTQLHQFGFNEGATERYIGILGGACAFPIFRLKDGETVGEIWGYVLNPDFPVDPDGNWNHIDQNGDGITMRDDYVQVGNALPRSSLGIANRLDWGRFEIDFQLRGVFGHDIVNHVKSFHSVRTIVPSYNVLYEAREELSFLTDFADFSDRDVENGSYLRLAYLTASYSLPLTRIKSVKSVKFYTTLQNLFTLTGYSGLDPEFRMEDRNQFSPMHYNYGRDALSDGGNPLVPGMDRRNTYPVSRAFVVGLQIDL